MGKSFVWVVKVSIGQGRSAIKRIFYAKVRDSANTKPWVEARNPSLKLNWEDAEVWKINR